ncbi:hypothetical protein [Spongiactinospora sp. TRM90649]|uniref:hypothetical protein n=1 Tax=Spongiactinospora sp. TRM90649 TaxID=3031114 RepID=UPI0023F76576|nr:hypothetical protein [Spongiactinospora sp. TRM90649]MDF5752838.1 hypothetical protein [Spongiactinospora sp. TRM90649]
MAGNGNGSTGFQVAGGFAVALLACLGAAALFSRGETVAQVVVVAVAVGGYSAAVRRPLPALVTAIFAWAFTTGFLVNSDGVLTVGTLADLERFALFWLAALAGVAWHLVAELLAHLRHARPSA